MLLQNFLYWSNLMRSQKMDIKQVLPTIQTFADLRPIVENADAHLSFWGSRYVTIRGFEGYLLLDDLPEHIFVLLHQHPIMLSLEEHNHGRVIQDRINVIYKRSDELVDQSNFLTWMMVAISSISDQIYHYIFLKDSPTRKTWGNNGLGVFWAREHAVRY